MFVKNIEFNNKSLLTLARKHHVIPLSNQEKTSFDKILNNGRDHLISDESLINWDPSYLKEAADLNLELFGKDAAIVIVIRDSMQYFSSIYQQTIHQGNIIPANKFFISKDVYEKVRLFYFQKKTLKLFNAEEFSLKKIYDVYNERFNSVYLVPLSKINDLMFVQDIYDISDDKMKILRYELINNPRYNKSYSSLAMKLTFKREVILNFFGLKSYGSWDNSPLNKLFIDNKISLPLFSNLDLLDKVKQLPMRIIKRFYWRVLMQNVVNKYLPYNKYKLPKGLPISKNKLREDCLFLKQLEKSNGASQHSCGK